MSFLKAADGPVPQSRDAVTSQSAPHFVVLGQNQCLSPELTTGAILRTSVHTDRQGCFGSRLDADCLSYALR